MSLMIVAAAILAQAPTAVQPAPPPPAATAPAVKAAKEKKICRFDDTDTSTRLRKKVCLTQTEWDRRQAGRNADDLKTLGAR